MFGVATKPLSEYDEEGAYV